MSIQLEARNSSLQDLLPLLQKQHDLKLDAVVPAKAITSKGGLLHVKGLSVFGDASVIRPTAIFDGHVADRLDIPVKYLRRLRESRVDLYDANVNGWLQGLTDYGWGQPGEPGYEPRKEIFAPDGRSFLLRTFSDPEGGEGIGRALLSDRYGSIENIDVLFAALDGIKGSGVHAEVVRANLSESKLSVRFACPEIAALAPTLLQNYNSPVPGWGSIERIREVAAREGHGYEPGKEPVVFAGFDLENSETGGGALNLIPVITVEICGNGLKLNALAIRKVHLGAKLDQGIVRWSQSTQQKSLALVASQTQDAVATFLSQEFLDDQIGQIEEKAGAPVTDAVKTIELVAKKLNYTEEEQAGILAHFITGGQLTAGGVLNAVTSYAQVVENVDNAAALEDSAIEAFELVAS